MILFNMPKNYNKNEEKQPHYMRSNIPLRERKKIAEEMMQELNERLHQVNLSYLVSKNRLDDLVLD